MVFSLSLSFKHIDNAPTILQKIWKTLEVWACDLHQITQSTSTPSEHFAFALIYL